MTDRAAAQGTTVVSVANLKGGVGKTTTAVHLAAGIARTGRRTLLVDLDAQGSATAHLLQATPGEQMPGVAEIIAGKARADQVVRMCSTEGLGVLPWSGEPEAPAEAWGDPDVASAALRRAFASAWSDGPPRYVIIDTAPHMGPATVAAIAASDCILVPVNCEYLPILGLKQFNEALARIRTRMRIPCKVIGYLLTQVDRRERITWEVEEILRRTFGSLVFRTMIRIDTRLKSCPSHRATAFEMQNESGRARTDFTELVAEFLARSESRDL